jgi:ABC-2 type transport system permease protein
MLETQNAPDEAQTPQPATAKTPAKIAGKSKKAGFSSNPIIMKELRNRMRSWRTALSLVLYTGALSIVGLLAYSTVAPNYFGASYYVYYNYRSISTAGVTIYTTIIIAQLALMFFLVPAFTSGVLTGEKERQTYDILLLTLLRPVDIVIGKLLSSLAYVLLLIVCSLPVASLSLLLGGVDLDQILVGLTVCVATALFFGTLGLWWSAVTTTTGRAVRNTLLTLLVITVGFPVLAWFLMINGSISGNDSIALYVFILIFSLNPAGAIFGTNEVLNGNTGQIKTIFFFEFDGIWFPQPWLSFTVFAIIMTVILFIAGTKAIKPVNPVEGGKAVKQKVKKQKQEVSNGNN